MRTTTTTVRTLNKEEWAARTREHFDLLLMAEQRAKRAYEQAQQAVHDYQNRYPELMAEKSEEQSA